MPVTSRSAWRRRTPIWCGCARTGWEDTPQLDVKIDYEKALAQGLSISDINSTSTAWGSSYVNDFVDRGRVRRSICRRMPPSG
ncbi:efflux RND transporter permease subunit [Escherichia coli]